MGLWGKSECKEETHTNTERKCKLHTERHLITYALWLAFGVYIDVKI